ncbi:MAG: hypothetical protein NTY02_04975 [Acidobacteria bacterium]|nr:hypothetical protein [Acidobacteriota bacterium]
MGAPAAAQTISQKGFVELKGIGYPQTTPQDDTQAVGEALLRYEVSAKPAAWFRLSGSIDARGDSHDQTTWDGVDWEDRGITRPGLSVRKLSGLFSRGPLSLEVGKQFVRWGKTDLLNPTDRFAPRDYLTVVDNEFLGVTGARLTAGLQSNTLDVVWTRFTPSRTPLLDQRWSGLPPDVQSLPLVDQGAAYPHRSQVGSRWSHVGHGFEFSLSAFNGNNNLPLIVTTMPSLPTGEVPPGTLLPPASSPGPPASVPILRVYPELWMAGGDAAVPLRHFTIKGEAAFFGTSDSRADEYWLYVIQVERQSGEWFFVGGYSGEVVTTQRTQAQFAPDRGMTKAFLGRAGYTIDTNRSLAFEAAVRQNGDGVWTRGEYSQASGQHLRLTVQATWIGGEPSDFFGRYDRNSHVSVTARYSF